MAVGDTILPFGKHKGQKLSEVPVRYLDWMLSIDLSPQLRADIEAYLKTQAEYEQMDQTPRDWKEGREDFVDDGT